MEGKFDDNGKKKKKKKKFKVIKLIGFEGELILFRWLCIIIIYFNFFVM